MINIETKKGASKVNGLSKSKYPLNFFERNLLFEYGSLMVNFTDIMTPLIRLCICSEWGRMLY